MWQQAFLFDHSLYLENVFDIVSVYDYAGHSFLEGFDETIVYSVHSKTHWPLIELVLDWRLIYFLINK